MSSTGPVSEPAAGTVTVSDLNKTLKALQAGLSVNGEHQDQLRALIEQVEAQLPKGPAEPTQAGAWVEASLVPARGGLPSVRRDFFRCGSREVPWVASGVQYLWSELVDPVVRFTSAGDNQLRARVRRLRDTQLWHERDLKGRDPQQAKRSARWAERLTKVLEEDPFGDDPFTDLVMRWEQQARDLRDKAKKWGSSPHAIRLGNEAQAYEDRATELKRALSA